jgi:hypothetical protein
MLTRPRLKTFLTIFPISDTTWGLRGGSDELWRIKLRDRRAFETFSAVLPYLDGSATVEQMHSALAAKGVEREDVDQLLERMEQSSLLEEAETYGLTEAETEAFAGQIAFFARYRGDGGNQYQARLRERRVAVLGNGDLAASLRREAAAAGFGEIYQLAADVEAAAASAELDGEPSPDWRARFRVLPLDRERIWDPAAGPVPDLLFVDVRELDMERRCAEHLRAPLPDQRTAPRCAARRHGPRPPSRLRHVGGTSVLLRSGRSHLSHQARWRSRYHKDRR